MNTKSKIWRVLLLVAGLIMTGASIYVYQKWFSLDATIGRYHKESKNYSNPMPGYHIWQKIKRYSSNPKVHALFLKIVDGVYDYRMRRGNLSSYMTDEVLSHILKQFELKHLQPGSQWVTSLGKLNYATFEEKDGSVKLPYNKQIRKIIKHYDKNRQVGEVLQKLLVTLPERIFDNPFYRVCRMYRKVIEHAAVRQDHASLLHSQGAKRGYARAYLVAMRYSKDDCRKKLKHTWKKFYATDKALGTAVVDVFFGIKKKKRQLLYTRHVMKMAIQSPEVFAGVLGQKLKAYCAANDSYECRYLLKRISRGATSLGVASTRMSPVPEDSIETLIKDLNTSEWSYKFGYAATRSAARFELKENLRSRLIYKQLQRKAETNLGAIWKAYNSDVPKAIELSARILAEKDTQRLSEQLGRTMKGFGPFSKYYGRYKTGSVEKRKPAIRKAIRIVLTLRGMQHHIDRNPKVLELFLQSLSFTDIEIVEFSSGVLKKKLNATRFANGLFTYMAKRRSIRISDKDVYVSILRHYPAISQPLATILDRLLIQAGGVPERVYWLYKVVALEALLYRGNRSALSVLTRYRNDRSSYLHTVVTREKHHPYKITGSTKKKVAFSGLVNQAIERIKSGRKPQAGSSSKPVYLRDYLRQRSR